MGGSHADGKSGLHSGHSVDAPAAGEELGRSDPVVADRLAVSERQVNHVADDHALRYIERRQRFEASQVVVVAARGPPLGAEPLESVQPSGQRSRVSDQLAGCVRSEQARPAREPAFDLGLERVVGRTPIRGAGHRHVGEVRVGPQQLPVSHLGLRQSSSRNRCPVEGIVHLLLELRSERESRVRDLIDGLGIHRQAGALRAGVSDIH